MVKKDIGFIFEGLSAFFPKGFIEVIQTEDDIKVWIGDAKFEGATNVNYFINEATEKQKWKIERVI